MEETVSEENETERNKDKAEEEKKQPEGNADGAAEENRQSEVTEEKE